MRWEVHVVGHGQWWCNRESNNARSCSKRRRKKTKKHYRINAVSATSSNKLLALVFVSSVTKSVLHKFLLWGQKAVKQHNTDIMNARQKHRTYLGPTPLSKLVCGKAEAMWADFNDLLAHDSEYDPNKWQPVFEFVADEHRAEMIELIMMVVLLGASAFEYLILGRTRNMPLLLLRMLDSPAHVQDEARRDIASAWRDASPEELSCKSTDDVACKFRIFLLR